MVAMGARRGPWSSVEDSYLLQLVQSQGANNWVRISHLIGSRSAKQCRERYHQNLKPSLNREPISPEEGILIESLVNELGKRWAEIARRLNGRSDNAVKNWWNGGMNRRRRLFVNRGDPGQCDAFDERNESPSFARPVNSCYHVGIPVRPTEAPVQYRRPHETPLPSPSTASEASATPSLVSDNGSNHSNRSPTLPISPSIELPPLIGTRTETRRPSLPVLHLTTGSGLNEKSRSRYQKIACAPHRASAEHMPPILRTPHPPTHLHPLQHPAEYGQPSLEAEHPRLTVHTALHEQKPLPDFMTVTAPLPRDQRHKDDRMSLSTLCA